MLLAVHRLSLHGLAVHCIVWPWAILAMVLFSDGDVWLWPMMAMGSAGHGLVLPWASHLLA
jgi:hypothetical protein